MNPLPAPRHLIPPTMPETAQVHVEQPELSVAARYEALIRVSQAVGVHREPKKLFDVLVGELRRVIEFDGFGIAQYDESTGRIQWHVFVRCNEKDVSLPSECSQRQSMTCWVYEHQQPIIVRDVEDETRFPDTI